jgi:hypothetical protein
MGTRGITDTILHFMGYLHLSQTIARSEVLFEGRFHTNTDDDTAGHRQAQPLRLAELEELAGHAVPIDAQLYDILNQDGIALAKTAATQMFPSVGIGARSAAAVAAPLHLPQAVNEAAGSFTRVISVNYDIGGTAGNVLIDQYNAMRDIDLITTDMLVSADGSNYAPQAPDLMHMQAEMILQAQEAVPAELRLGSAQTTENVLSAVMLRDADWIETGAASWQKTEAAGQITPLQNGRYVDGALSSDDVAKIEALQVTPWRTAETDSTLSAPNVPVLSSAQSTVTQTSAEASAPDGGIMSYQTSTITGPSEPETVIIEAGQNIQTNAAIIRDMNDMGRSMIVGGDYVFSQGIVQVNILTDSDHVNIATSGMGMPAVFSSGNEVHNIAEFRHVSFNTVGNGAAVTANWQVDIFKADFYDVKAIYQFNNMIDGDTVTQATSGIFSSFQTGQNEQANLVQLSGLDSYDLIIITGSYHRANWICQYNIVLDVDVVNMLSANEEGGSATVTTGFNGLTNDALIVTYDSDAFRPMNGAHTKLMEALANGDTILAPNPDWQLAGNASGTLRVLYIDGDYYDVNVITQVNLLYDVDQIAQASNSAGAAQGVASGGNIALNEARIVDPGILSASKYLGGDAYEASVLIQTNIVTDSDMVVIHDTQTLIPEFVAFAQEDLTQPDCEIVPRPYADPALQHDNFGNVLN